MARVLTAAVFVPSPPLLVPELNGLAANETDELRSAALAAVSEIGDCTEWVVVGTGRDVERIAATATGTFRGYGADVRVGLGPDATGDADPDLALPALIAGWLRGRAAPGVRAEVHVVPADAGRDECTRLGQRLRTELDEDDTRRGLLVIADGAATLTAKAPGAFDARAEAVETDLAAALAAGDPSALAALDPDLCAEIVLDGRAAWHVLAGAFTTAPSAVKIAYRGAPYGVGYHVGTWRP